MAMEGKSFEMEVREHLTHLETQMQHVATKADIKSLGASMRKATGGLGIMLAAMLVSIW